MKSIQITAALLVTLLLSTQSAYAYGDYTTNEHIGAYVDAHAGIILSRIEVFDDHYTESSGFGLTVDLGYQFFDYFAVEAGLTHWQGENNDSDDTSLNFAQALVKGILPINEQFNVFAKLGIAASLVGSEEGYAPYAGLGAGFGITPNVDLTFQMSGLLDAFGEVGIVGAGVTYYFQFSICCHGERSDNILSNT